MNQSSYRFATHSLPIIAALAILCIVLWRKWRDADTAHRATLSEFAGEFYVPS